MVKWVEREEASGQSTPPICPFCRSNISDEDVQAILGRPFQPRETEMADDEEMDELTLQWLNEHTMPCRGCGSRIEKESGCPLIECLCGYRFCFSCGVAGGQCDCSPEHIFENDDEELNDTDNFDASALLRDENGHVDLGLCILRREVQDKRRNEREENEYEVRTRWEFSSWVHDALAVSSGRWLFASPTYFESVSVLKRELGTSMGDQTRGHRAYQQYSSSREALDRWKCSEIDAGLCTVNGRWLFCPKNNGGSIKMLQEQANYDKVVRTRKSESYTWGRGYSWGPAPWRLEEKKRWNYSPTRVNVCTANGRWLFSSKWSCRCVNMLEQQLQFDRVHDERYFRRRNLNFLDCSDY